MQGLQLDTISRSFFFQIGYTAKKTHGGLWEREQEELRAKREAKQKLEMLQKLALVEEKKALFRQRLQVSKSAAYYQLLFLPEPNSQISVKLQAEMQVYNMRFAKSSREFYSLQDPLCFQRGNKLWNFNLDDGLHLSHYW